MPVLRKIQSLLILAAAIAVLPACQPKDHNAALRIYGGEAVPRNGHPAVVALHESRKIVCSGTLIHPNVVLTAGHCLVNGTVAAPLTGVSTGPGHEGGEKKPDIEISDQAVHPEFKVHPRGNMDLGLVFLDKPVEKTKPVSVEDGTAKVREWLGLAKPGDSGIIVTPKMTMVGYGRREDGGKGRKFAVSVPITQTNPSEIAIGGSGKDSCEGDSGGPVLSPDGGVIAVISRGLTIGCGGGGIATVVADASCWIREESMNRGFEIEVSQPCGDASGQDVALNQALQQSGEGQQSIDLSGWYLESISGLRWLAPDATSVNLKGNHLVDVSELLMLPRIRDVDLSFNNVPLEQIDDLRKQGIEVRGANLQTSTFLATPFFEACSRLDQTTLTDGEKSLIKALRARYGSNDCAAINTRLVKTLRLQLNSRGILSVSLLAGLPLLEQLDLSDNPIESLDPLAGLENLKYLKVERIPATVLERDLATLNLLTERGVQVIIAATR